MLILVRLEILNLLRDRRLAVAMAVFAGTLLVSGAASWATVHRDARIKASVAAEERQRWLDQGEKDPHSAAHYSVYAFKPALPLQALDPGILPFVGEAVWLEAHLQNDLLFRPQQDASAVERLGLIDPAGLFARFGPLAILLLAFAAAARERDHGVLGLALGTASTRTAYLGAKAASVTIIAAAALLIPVMLTGAISIASSTGRIDDVARIAAWTLSAFGYAAILATLAVSVCVTARTVQTAFGILLLAWIVLVVAALPSASAVAEWRSPIPSFQQMKLVLADEAPAYWSPETGAEQIATILQRYGASREVELEGRVNVRGAQLDVAERHAQAVFDREIGGFYDRVLAQDLTYARLGWLSPAIAFDVVSAGFAGTDFLHHRHFIDFAERYRRVLVNRMNADLIPNPAVNGSEHTSDINLWSEIPPFEYTPLPPLSAWRSATAPLLALAAWFLGAAALLVATSVHVRP